MLDLESKFALIRLSGMSKHNGEEKQERIELEHKIVGKIL